MSIATATVSIAPFPVPMQVDEPPPKEDLDGLPDLDGLSNEEIRARYGTCIGKAPLFVGLEEACVKIESVTAIMNECSALIEPEPEEARVMVDAEVTELVEAVVKVEPTSAAHNEAVRPLKAVVPEVVQQQRKAAFSITAPHQSAFSEFAKDLPPCCPMTMPSGKTTLPAQHVIAAFFAGALIGCALVMCFSDTGVVAAE